MTDPHIQYLLRQAVRTSDPAVMRQAIDRLVAGGPDALSAEAEYETRHEDFVMEMPQSGERIRGREAMQSMQEAFPTPPTISVRRMLGSNGIWVIEGVNDYKEDVWHVVVILELDPDGRILRDTRYYAKPFDAPEWRAAWVEPM
jgi:hypothetical protein